MGIACAFTKSGIGLIISGGLNIIGEMRLKRDTHAAHFERMGWIEPQWRLKIFSFVLKQPEGQEFDKSGKRERSPINLNQMSALIPLFYRAFDAQSESDRAKTALIIKLFQIEHKTLYAISRDGAAHVKPPRAAFNLSGDVGVRDRVIP